MDYYYKYLKYKTKYFELKGGLVSRQQQKRPPTTGLSTKPPTAELSSRPPTAELSSRPPTAGLLSRPSTTGLLSRPSTTGISNRPSTIPKQFILDNIDEDNPTFNVKKASIHQKSEIKKNLI